MSARYSKTSARGLPTVTDTVTGSISRGPSYGVRLRHVRLWVTVFGRRCRVPVRGAAGAAPVDIVVIIGTSGSATRRRYGVAHVGHPGGHRFVPVRGMRVCGHPHGGRRAAR